MAVAGFDTASVSSTSISGNRPSVRQRQEEFRRGREIPRRHGVGRTVMEATGRFHRRIHRSLASRGFGVCVTTPRQARDFARAALREASAGPGIGSRGNNSGSRSDAWRKGGRCPAKKSADIPEPGCRKPTPSHHWSQRRAGHGGGTGRRCAICLRQRRQDGQVPGEGRTVRANPVYGRDDRGDIQRAADSVPSKARKRSQLAKWRSSQACESPGSGEHTASRTTPREDRGPAVTRNRTREIPGSEKPVWPFGRPTAPVFDRVGRLWINQG